MKKIILMLIPFLISAVCFVAYATMGTGDTITVEQFYLIIGSMVFFFIGVVGLIVFLLTKVVKKMNEM